jgi:hypothetical protein
VNVPFCRSKTFLFALVSDSWVILWSLFGNGISNSENEEMEFRTLWILVRLHLMPTWHPWQVTSFLTMADPLSNPLHI